MPIADKTKVHVDGGTCVCEEEGGDGEEAGCRPKYRQGKGGSRSGHALQSHFLKHIFSR